MLKPPDKSKIYQKIWCGPYAFATIMGMPYKRAVTELLAIEREVDNIPYKNMREAGGTSLRAMQLGFDKYGVVVEFATNIHPFKVLQGSLIKETDVVLYATNYHYVPSVEYRRYDALAAFPGERLYPFFTPYFYAKFR